MKSLWGDKMNDALALVRKARLGEATALLTGGLPGKADPAASRPPAGPAPQRRAARPLGEIVSALRSGRAAFARAPLAPPIAPDVFDERFQARRFDAPAGSLSYRLYVPANEDKRPLSLVMMLHGCTQTPEDFAIGTRMNDLAEEFGLVVAYPQQSRAANPQGCWNWFDARNQQRDSGEPAVLAGLARHLAAEFAIPRERCFVAGLSAGGAMTEILATLYPDVFEAAAIHSGLPYGSASDVASAFAAMKGNATSPGRARPVGAYQTRRIIFHGGADPTVHPQNAVRLMEEARGRSPGHSEVALDWRIDSGRVDRSTLRNSAGDAHTEHWLVAGGGHAWFGGDPRGSYTQDVGLDASRVMTRFFLKE